VTRSHTGIDVIGFSGELDVARKGELRSALDGITSPAGVVVDLSGVTYADSTALTELLRFRIDARKRGVPVAMAVATPQLERILRYAGLYDAFEIFGSCDEALHHLEGAR
jgi:anti-sigma B factor antagonist